MATKKKRKFITFTSTFEVIELSKKQAKGLNKKNLFEFSLTPVLKNKKNKK